MDNLFFQEIFTDTETDIRSRLLDPFLAGEGEQNFNVREGSFLYDLTTSASLEFLRFYVRLNQVASIGYILGAWGSALDAKGAELRVTRKQATRAEVGITVEGQVGTVIPAGTVFSTTSLGGEFDPSIEFVSDEDVTIPASGSVLVSASAVEVGKAGNVDAHAITQIVQPPIANIALVTNDTPAFGGSDEEDDLAYRERVVQAAQSIAGPGTRADYEVWATSIPGAADAVVFPHWAGGGTVKVVVIGPDRTSPTSAVLREVQDYLDPSVALISTMEPDEPWSGMTFDSTWKAEGSTSARLEAAASQTVTASMSNVLGLDYIQSSDKFSVWCNIDSSYLSNLDLLSFSLVDSAGLKAKKDFPRAALGPGPLLLEWSTADMTFDSAFNWALTTGVEVSVSASTTGPTVVNVDAWRVTDHDGGVGQGMAPVGAQVTVVGARLVPVDIYVNITPDSGYTIDTIYPSLRVAMAEFLKQVDSSNGFLYLTDVANVVHDTPGVLTFSELKIEGNEHDLEIDSVDVIYLDTLIVT